MYIIMYPSYDDLRVTYYFKNLNFEANNFL